MGSMEAIRVALASNLSSIEGVQVSPWMLANPTPPAIHVIPGPTEYHATMGVGGAEWWEFTIQAFVASVSDIGSQKRLDRMLDSDGSESVFAALESDRTLGGECDDLIVTLRSGYQVFVPQGRSEVLGAEWTVRVFV